MKGVFWIFDVTDDGDAIGMFIKWMVFEKL